MHHRSARVSPATPASGDSTVSRIVALFRRQRLLHHARRALVVGGVVALLGAGVSVGLAVAGWHTCETTDHVESCTDLAFYPLSVQLKAERHTRAGVLHGRQLEWHPNGTLWLAGNYEHGARVGTWQEWHRNGLTRFIGHYESDHLVGHEQWWYANGQLEWEVDRVGGKREGYESWWYPNGALRRTGMYKKGDRDGAFTFYNETGDVLFRSTYVNGVSKGADQT
jgi:hypothetical protein